MVFSGIKETKKKTGIVSSNVFKIENYTNVIYSIFKKNIKCVCKMGEGKTYN